MAVRRQAVRAGCSALMVAFLPLVLADAAAAGPLLRRVEQRKACQQFAAKLQQASGNPAMAQQVYQQGVLQLVARFGENPCSDIPAPAPTPAGAAGAPPAAVTPPAATPPAAVPAGTPPRAPANAAPAPQPAVSPQQQQACQQFAAALQSASARGGAAVQQTYSMGLQKLSGLFGANPCPAVKLPQ
ncbi:MAG: hypothetical protein VKK62_01135 [Synechococcaceae cyanobacterium]|nr:hypothetical protein [Synechococcaceae cyanobacterium]